MNLAKKHLSFGNLRKIVSEAVRGVEDGRDEAHRDYSIHDTALSGLSMMYFQDASLLQFQKRLEQKLQLSNLQTLFDVKAVPSDTQMREILDAVPSKSFRPVFREYLSALQRGKHLEQYRVIDGAYLCSLDGSEYFNSPRVNCPHCLHRKKGKKGEYFCHQILQPVLVHPDMAQVLPLCPEEISNSDGQEKQDCEINAAKRLLKKLRKEHPFLKLVINGDGLYSKQPLIELIRSLLMNFILVAKPGDHKILWEWFEEQKKLGEVSRWEWTDEKGRKHRYEWINKIPLGGNENTIEVNFFIYKLIVDKKTTYQNSWVTDFEITKDNVALLVKSGRARWKIENECFNTLKNQGYHIDHNYGHGKANLSFNFFLLNLIAFFMHQIFELTDTLYQKARVKCGSKAFLWENIRGAIRWFVYETWESLLLHAIWSDDHPPPTLQLSPQ
jgi:hypothetical protein